jgi:transcription-repair coupling factor (superfamily II helicase)
VAFHASAADTTARSLKEAEPELEKLVRSGYRTVVTWARRGEGERAAYNLARLSAPWTTEHAPAEAELRFAHVALRDGFVAAPFRLAVLPEHRLLRRRRAEAPAVPRPGILRSFADLRTGDVVVHEDHGVARFAGFDTKTVAGVTRDYLDLEFQGSDRVFMPVDQLAKISRYVGADATDPPLSKLGGKRWDQLKTRARRAAQELAGECSTSTPSAVAGPATPSRPTPSGSATSRPASRGPRRPNSRTPSRRSRPTWRPRARWTA